MWDSILKVLVGLGLGGVLGWWLTQRFGLEIAHKHRIIEEHAKKVHEYSEKYYVKLNAYVGFVENCLREILGQLRKSKAPSKETIELSLFGWARLSKLEEEWFRDTSTTLMLTDRMAEEAIACLREQVEELFASKLNCISREDDSILRQHIETHEPLSRFKVKIKKQPLEQIADKYKVAIQRDTKLLGLLVDTLGCLQKLLYFEVNSCFDAWYQKKTPRPCFQKREWLTVDATLNRLVKKGKASTDDKKAYLKKIGKSNKKKFASLLGRKLVSRLRKR